MKSVYITLLTIVGVVLSVNAVAQTEGSLNEYGETIDEYGGILLPPAGGDTVKFKRIAGTSAYNVDGSTKIYNPQQGTALMVICNDSVYYWKSPITWMPIAQYWMKGLYDKQAQTVTFAQGQANYYHPTGDVSTLGWCVRNPNVSPKYQVALDYADAFVFDMKGDTLILRGSQTFNSSTKEPAYFMGSVFGTTFQKTGDGGTQLLRQYPVAERDTVDVAAIRLQRDYTGTNGHGYTNYISKNGEYDLIELSINGDKKMGTFVTAGINYSKSVLTTMEGEKIKFYDGELTVFEDNEGYKMQGIMIGTDEKAYVIDLIQPVGTFNMDAFVDLDLTISMDSVEITRKGDSGCFVVTAFLWDYYVELDLFAGAFADTLPVGDYVVSDTQLPFTALQSIGYIESEVHPSCVVAISSHGDGTASTDNLWLFVSGTISVNADGSIFAVGKNSYGRDIHIQFTPPTEHTGLTTPNKDAHKLVRKVLRQGQFLIQYAGKAYNLLGASICH